MKTTSLVFALSGILFGCGEIQNSVGFTKVEPPVEKIDDSFSRPQCEIDYYDFKIDTHVVSFEITDKRGGHFGFSLLTGFVQALGLSLNVKTSQMTFVMDVSQNLNELTSVQGSVDGKEVGFKGDIGFQGMGFGYEHFVKTPLAKMVQKGLVNTIKNVATDIDSRISTGRLDTWSTRVLKTSNTSANKVIIQAGANSGLKSGDELAVYHINHEWEGEPCNSRYLGWSFASDVPVATLKVTDNIKLNPNFSTVEIIDPHSIQSSIHPGDYVTVHKLVPGINNTLRSPLARSIHIGTTDAGKFLIENTEIDLASYVKLLIKPSILDSSLQGKYYIH